MRRFLTLSAIAVIAATISSVGAFTGTPAGDVRAKVTFIGDSNISRAATQIVSVLSPPRFGYVPTFTSRDGASLFWNGCDPAPATCPNPNATDFWQQRLADLPVADIYVIDLGIVDAKTQGTATTQGYAWWSQKIDWLMGQMHGKPVLWSNLPCGRVEAVRVTGCLAINQALWNARSRWPNLVFVQWRTLAEANYPAWFDPDGVHYSAAGYLGYANLIKTQLDAVPTTA